MGNPGGVKEAPVYFHQEQVKYLEKIFPESVFSPEASESSLRHYNGQRSVIKFIQSRQRT